MRKQSTIWQLRRQLAASDEACIRCTCKLEARGLGHEQGRLSSFVGGRCSKRKHCDRDKYSMIIE